MLCNLSVCQNRAVADAEEERGALHGFLSRGPTGVGCQVERSGIYLEKNICTHCFSMRYYWFLVFTFSIPTVQLNTSKDPRKISPFLVLQYRWAAWDKFWAVMFRAVSYQAVWGITQFLLSCTCVISDCFYYFRYSTLNTVHVGQNINTWRKKIALQHSFIYYLTQLTVTHTSRSRNQAGNHKHSHLLIGFLIVKQEALWKSLSFWYQNYLSYNPTPDTNFYIPLPSNVFLWESLKYVYFHLWHWYIYAFSYILYLHQVYYVDL